MWSTHPRQSEQMKIKYIVIKRDVNNTQKNADKIFRMTIDQEAYSVFEPLNVSINC
jgi:hypothetical protein